MNSRLAFPSRIVLAGLVGGLGLFLAGGAFGQRLEDGEEALNKANNKVLRPLRNKLFKGEEPADPNNKEHMESLDVGAELVTYKYAWPEYHETDPNLLGKSKLHGIHGIFEELEGNLNQLASPKYRPNNQVATRLFCQQVLVRGQEVLEKELADKARPIVLINATRAMTRLVERGISQNEKDWGEEVVPRLAGTNAEQLATLSLGLLKAPRGNDGVRYHALRGLGNLLAVPKQEPDLLKASRDKIAREALAFTEDLNKRKFARSATRPQIEGLKALRREVVRVIARHPSPFIGEKEYPALFLALIAGNDKRLNVEARLDERLEASIGLARMQATGPLAGAYHPDYAAEQIARFTRDFAIAANAERENKAFERTRPWKVEAARLNDALNVMAAQVKTDYVRQVIEKAKPVLNKIEKGVDAGAADFTDWVDRNSAPTPRLYRDLPASSIEKRDAKE